MPEHARAGPAPKAGASAAAAVRAAAAAAGRAGEARILVGGRDAVVGRAAHVLSRFVFFGL